MAARGRELTDGQSRYRFFWSYKAPESSLETLITKLALLKDFRTFDWAEEYKYPTVVLDQMKGLLAKYENL